MNLNVPISTMARRLLQASQDSLRDGNWSIYLTLALSLALNFGGIGIVAAGALVRIATSRLRLVVDAAKLYFTDWLRSDAFALNLLVLVVTLVELGLVFYHGDDMAQFETQLKQYVTALAVLLTIRRYPVEVVLWGAAAGCFLGAVLAFRDIAVLDMPRADGATNAIRFGMVGALLAIFSWIGALFGRISLPGRLFMAAAAFAGIFAVFASGSRGAVIAIPIMLLMLLPRIWRWMGRRALLVGVIFMLFSAALGAWQLSALRSGWYGIQNVVEALTSDRPMYDYSMRDRINMLRLSADLFASNPWFGVGDRGWQAAVAEQRRTSAEDVAFTQQFNQAHNQYANDLAKGGLVRSIGGLAMLFLPLYFFARRRPFRAGRESLAALLGVVTCTAYAVFALTESVMDLSLTGSLYAVLIYYLIAAAEGAPLGPTDSGNTRSGADKLLPALRGE